MNSKDDKPKSPHVPAQPWNTLAFSTNSDFVMNSTSGALEIFRPLKVRCPQHGVQDAFTLFGRPRQGNYRCYECVVQWVETNVPERPDATNDPET